MFKCLPIEENKRRLMLAFLFYKVCQIQFTSTYNNNKVTGIVGSSVNFTWTFSGDVEVARLVTQDGLTELLVISINKVLQVSTGINSPYSGRVSAVWNGKSPGQVTFTLNLVRITDEGFYMCKLKPVDDFQNSPSDTLQLIVLGK